MHSSTRILSDAVVPLDQDTPAIEDTLTWTIVGLFLGLIFYGIMLSLTYEYFRTYHKDTKVVKILVGVLIVTETVHSALSMHWGYYYLIENYGNAEAYTTPTISLALLPLTVLAIIVTSQIFYIRRAYLILPCGLLKYAFLVFAATLMGCSIAFCIALTVLILLYGSYEHWLKYKWLVSAAFAPPAVGDLVIAAFLCFSLHRSHTGVKRTDKLLNVLIAYGFSTGVFTSIISGGCLITDILEERNLVIIPFSLTAANIYAFSVLVTLNLRQGLAARLSSHDVATEWLGMSALEAGLPMTVDVEDSVQP